MYTGSVDWISLKHCSINAMCNMYFQKKETERRRESERETEKERESERKERVKKSFKSSYSTTRTLM